MSRGNLPTKKERELLSFIDGFIKGNGYSPSFREIQRSLGYKSVSTVATHVDNLVVKGYLRKVDNSARTLEVCTPATAEQNPHIEWLNAEIDKKLSDEAIGDDDRTALERVKTMFS